MTVADNEIRAAHGDTAVGSQTAKYYPDHIYEEAVRQAEITANSDPKDL